ncbi:unnamed protein product [Calypogeia fissa]
MGITTVVFPNEAAHNLMHHEISPKRMHLGRRVLIMSDSDDSPVCTPTCSSLRPSTSRRRADSARSRGAKRLSPDSSNFFSMSSQLWLGSEVRTLSLTRSSCGSPGGSVSSMRGLDWETVPHGLQQDLDAIGEASHRHRAKESRKTEELDVGGKGSGAEWESVNLDSPGAGSAGDGSCVIGADGQRLSLVWMCGRDAASIVSQSGFNWIDVVHPSLDDLHGDQWELVVHSGDLERCRAVFTDALANQRPYEVEYRIQTSPDSYRWIMESAKPRFSWNRDFLGYVGWRIDIHKQKSFENDLKQFMAMSHEILVEANPDGRTYKNVSPSFPRLLGYTKEEFLSMEWVFLLHPDDRAHTISEFNKCSDGDSVYGVVNRFRCKPGATVLGPVSSDPTGTYKWFSWTADKMYGAGRDITAERIAQEELRRSQAELRRITDAIPGGVFQYKIDENGVETFPFISKGALDLCSSRSDCEPEEETNPVDVINRYSHQHSGGKAVYRDDLMTLREAIHQSSSAALVAHANLDCDYRIIKNGKVRWVRVHAVPQFGANNATKEWCGVTWDITDRHLLEEALREARDVAERSNEAKGIFLANMSHEIRTPMNAVIGSGVLLHETELTEEQREYVATIRSSGEALLSIINDILDFSKIEAGKLDLEVASFSISDCIEASLDLISTPAAQKGLELNYTIAEDVPCVIKGDVSRVRQILVNLLSNATKFTEQGSVSVNVSGRRLHERSSPTSFLEGEDSPPVFSKDAKAAVWEIKFSVKDSGIGIPYDKTHTLFEPFRQLDASTTRKHGGTGLGLAICARLCSLWGGEIKVESVPGEGSTFHFTLTGEETLEARNAVEEDDIPALKNKRVLVIAGSHSSSQTLCARLLKSWQVRVVSAEAADEALQEVQHVLDHSEDEHSCIKRHSTLKDPFMAAVVDFGMIDDPQVVEALQLCQSSYPRFPLILLTPFGCRFQDYIDGLGIKFATHVSKPIKESQLRGALMKIIIDHSDERVTENGLQQATPRSRNWTRRLNSGSHLKMDENTGKKYPLKILIAEDNGTNQKVLVRLLQKLGYNADVVGNGIEAVSAALRQSYDVILMDCFMPEMDGLEATKHIRLHVQPCPVIVAITAAALEEEKKACLQAGLHMYISKPIKAELLIRTLHMCWQVKAEEITVDSLQQQGLSSPRSQRPY